MKINTIKVKVKSDTLNDMQKKYIVYILQCSDKSLYVGKTINMQKRLRQHNGEIKGGAKYTRSKRPVKLFYIEEFISHKEAAQREIQLKRFTHEEKKLLGSMPLHS